MIKIDFDSTKESSRIEIEGTFSDIVSELGSIIHIIHVRICKGSFLRGMAFEQLFRDPGFWEEVFKQKAEDGNLFREGSGEE